MKKKQQSVFFVFWTPTGKKGDFSNTAHSFKSSLFEKSFFSLLASTLYPVVYHAKVNSKVLPSVQKLVANFRVSGL
jgi:hypothetical protein